MGWRRSGGGRGVARRTGCGGEAENACRGRAHHINKSHLLPKSALPLWAGCQDALVCVQAVPSREGAPVTPPVPPCAPPPSPGSRSS